MTLTEEAERNRPLKPTNVYFYFLAKRRAEKEGLSLQQLSDEYNALSAEKKDKLRADLKKLAESYPEDLANWRKKYNVSAYDEKRKASKSKQSKGEESDAETKAEKTKGDKKVGRPKNSEKSSDKKKSSEKKSEKPKSKSKGK